MKKLLRIILSFLLVFSNGWMVAAKQDPNEEFEELLNGWFREDMEADYLTMHFAVRDYKAYGIEKPEPNMGTVGAIDDTSEADGIQERIDALKEVDYDSLSDVNQHAYDVALFDLETYLPIARHPELDFLFSYTNALTDNINVNLIEFVFYSKEDVEDYLLVAESIPEFLDDAIELTEQQAEQGLFITDHDLEQSLEQLDLFLEKKGDDSGLITSFNTKIEKMDGLSDEEISEYKERNAKIIKEDVIPSYQKTRDALAKLEGSRKYPAGFCNLPGGKEYFEAKIRRQLSTEGSVDDAFDMMDRYLKNNLLKYFMLAQQMEGQEYESDLSEPQEILEDLRDSLQNFPEGYSKDFTVEILDKSLSTSTTLAYYVTPAIDAPDVNSIKVNEETIRKSSNVEMYTTLGHEGYGGHLLQNTWYVNTNPNPYLTNLSLLGYGEGWAEYSLRDTLANTDLAGDFADFAMLENTFYYILDGVVDIGVNYYGWDEDDLADYLEQRGLVPDIAETLHEEVSSMPGVLLPYGGGTIQFLALREKAEKAIGDSFDPVSFNEVLLTYGPRQFEVVEKDVDAYIESITGKKPETPTASPEPPENGTSSQSLSPLMYFGIGAVIGTVVLLIFAVILHRKNKEKL